MLKIGLFGVGHLGSIHARLIGELSHRFSFVGFCDPDDEQAEKAASSLGVQRYRDLRELIEQVDCLSIVTPTPAHWKIASTAIALGRHVFVEKPFTETIEEAHQLLRLAQQHRVVVQVGHVERFNPAFKEAKPYLNRPLFIEAHRLAQYNPRGTDVPVVLDLMIHDLDAVLSLVRTPVRRISASGVAVISETPDIANARLEFESGCVVNLTASRISLKNMRKMRCFQKEAYVAIDFLEKTTEIVKMTPLADTQLEPFDLVFDPGEGKPKKKIELLKPPIHASNAIREELASFANCIENGTAPVVSGEDGTRALEVAHSIMEEMQRNSRFIQENI